MEKYYEEREQQIEKVNKVKYINLFESLLERIQKWIELEKVGPHKHRFIVGNELADLQDLFVQYACHRLPLYEITCDERNEFAVFVTLRYSTVEEYIVSLLRLKQTLVIPPKSKFSQEEIDAYLIPFFDSLTKIDENTATNEYFILKKNKIFITDTTFRWEWTFYYFTDTRIALERHIASMILGAK